MKLTIGMATYDDYDGVYFTVQSLRLHHILPPGTEFLVIDNNPDSDHGRMLASFAKQIPGMRVVGASERKSSFIKYDMLDHATGDVVLGLDCHVLLQLGFIDALMGYWKAHPESRDMLTGPLIYNDMKATSVKMEPKWRGHDFGCWGDDPEAMKAGVPFEVPMQGMGCFSFLKNNAPMVGKKFTGFGAEEWYIAEKTRLNGGRVMCHPAMGWNHRFEWPKRTFPLSMHDKIRNYYIGWLEVYGSPSHPMIQKMTEHWETLMSREELFKISQPLFSSLPS